MTFVRASVLALGGLASLASPSPPPALPTGSGASMSAPATSAPTEPATPSAVAPFGAKGFDVRLTSFRMAYDVSINGHLIGRLRDNGAEVTITSYVVHGLNHVHVHWFSEGQPSAGSLGIRYGDDAGNFHSFLHIQKFPLSDSDALRDYTFLWPSN